MNTLWLMLILWIGVILGVLGIGALAGILYERYQWNILIKRGILPPPPGVRR